PCGQFGKTHTWDIYWDNYNVQGYDVTEPGDCFGGSACYPGYDTPVWLDPNKNTWNEVTHNPRISSVDFTCRLDGPAKDHRLPHYCNAEEADDEDTCQANGWYWNSFMNTCHENTPPPGGGCD